MHIKNEEINGTRKSQVYFSAENYCWAVDLFDTKDKYSACKFFNTQEEAVNEGYKFVETDRGLLNE